MLCVKIVLALIPVLCTVDAARHMRKSHAAGVLDQAESEVNQMDDTSNQALWKHAWEETLEKYHVAENDANAQQAVYPEAKKYYKSLIQARHTLREQNQQESAGSSAAQSDEETLEDLKQQMAEKLTANLKNIKDDDTPVVTTTTTTTSESADQLQMEQLRAAANEKLTARLKEVKDDDDTATTTTAKPQPESAEAKQQREDQDKLAELKDEMAKKLTEDHPESQAQDSKSFVQEQSTTTTTTTMNEEQQEKTLALLKTGNLGGNLFSRYKPAEQPAPVQAKPAQPQPVDTSSDSEGEVSSDFDQYDNMS